MDFNYVYTYEHQLWRVGEARMTFDFDHLISSKATFLHFKRFRYAILNLDEPNPVEKVVSKLIRSLFERTQLRDSSRLLPLKIELEPAPLDLKSRLRLEIRDYAEAALADARSQSRRRIQIGVILEVRRDQAQTEPSGLEKVGFERRLMEEECAICFNKYKEEEEIRRMPCQHVFHGKCIFNWLKKSKSCPLCRFKLSSS